MSHLTLNLLGPYEAMLADDQRLQLATAKAQALLAYLLVKEAQLPGTSYQRGALMTLFWPETTPASAQNNLRQTLYRLRQTLPDVDGGTDKAEPLLLSDRQSVWVNSQANYRLDIATFEESLQKANQQPDEQIAFLSKATALYRGDFLTDLYIPDSDEFEQWAQRVREQMRRQMLGALKQITDHALTGEDYDQALAAARRQVAIDNFSEAAHRQLMTALAYNGQRGEALTHYDSCRQTLWDELGVEPATETQQLAETIRQGEFEPQPRTDLHQPMPLPMRADSVAPGQPPEPAVTLQQQPSQIKEMTVPLPDLGRLDGSEWGVSAPVDRDDTQLILLNKVKSFWIESVLEQAQDQAGLIALTKEVRPEAISSPWTQVIAEPTKPRWTLPDGMGIAELFDDMAQALLILGEPGSGKTIELLILARAAIVLAEADPTRPVPVVFNLSSWSGQFATLAAWLVEELNGKYLIPKKLGQDWIDDDKLLLLLDGLDEVASSRIADCVTAINQFRKDHGLARLAVCSRTEAYEVLDEKLWVDYAICLRPLSPAQIDAYLQIRNINPALFRQEMMSDSGLQEMSRSPLMLNLIALTYQEPAATAFSELDSATNRRNHLFATYVDQMIQRRGQDDQYAADEVVQHLSWLAQKMTQHDESIFLIERMQNSWLTRRSSRWILGFLAMWFTFLSFVTLYTLLLTESTIPRSLGELLPSALLSTTLVVLILHSLYHIREESRLGQHQTPNNSSARIVWVIGLGLFAGLITFAIFALLTPFMGIPLTESMPLIIFSALGIGMGLGIQEQLQTSGGGIQTVEALQWSWRRSLRGVGIGLLIWGSVVIVNLFMEGAAALMQDWWGNVIAGALGPVLAFGCLFGVTRTSVPLKTVPGQGVWLSLRNTIVIGAIVMIVVGVVGGLSDQIGDIVFSRSPAPSAQLIGMRVRLSVGTGLLMALFFGGVTALVHGLLRFFVWQEGGLPLNLTRFLDHAVQLNFMRRVGGGYIFMHKLLQDYFLEKGCHNQ